MRSKWQKSDKETLGIEVDDIYSSLYNEGEITTSPYGLPYTEDFEVLYAAVTELYPNLTRYQVLTALLTVRKKGLGGVRSRKKVDTLSLQQVRALRVLNTHPGGLSANDLQRLADITAITTLVGPKSVEDLQEMGRTATLCLLGREMVDVMQEERDRGSVAIYLITDKGREALKEHLQK